MLFHLSLFISNIQERKYQLFHSSGLTLKFYIGKASLIPSFYGIFAPTIYHLTRQNIKNIIFDYGNVIFTLDFSKGQRAWQELGINDPGQFYGHKIQDAVFDDFERGEILPADFRNHIRNKTGNRYLSDEQIDKAWNSLLVKIEEGNHELLLSLKLKYRTFLLSNINAIHYTYILRYLKAEFGFDNNDHLFEKTYYSHLVGKRKPDINIFKQVIDENNLVPAETLFIDDSPQHLEGAKKLGIQTFLLTAPDNIQALFKRIAETGNV